MYTLVNLNPLKFNLSLTTIVNCDYWKITYVNVDACMVPNSYGTWQDNVRQVIIFIHKKEVTSYKTPIIHLYFLL